MPLTVIFLGKSGSGKGTQVELLMQKEHFQVIEMGKLLREFSKQENAVAKRLANVLHEGKLAPSWLVMYLWMNELLSKVDHVKNVVFDGSCRLLEEAKMLDEVLAWFERMPPKIFLIDIDDEEAVRRLQTRGICSGCRKIYLGNAPEVASGICSVCGGTVAKRHDDDPKAIQSRVAWFMTDVMPVVRHYEAKGWLIRIDGEQPPEKVHEEIMKYLAKQ